MNVFLLLVLILIVLNQFRLNWRLNEQEKMIDELFDRQNGRKDKTHMIDKEFIREWLRTRELRKVVHQVLASMPRKVDTK